jgi:hypothetical protein
MKWLLFLIPFCTFSQSPIDNALEYWIQFQDEATETEQFSLALESYQTNQLQINTATEKELSNFPLFHQKHISIILQYIRRNQNILSWNELKQLPYFDNEFIQIIQPFISLSMRKFVPRSKFSILYKTKIPLEKPVGYENKNNSSQIAGPWFYQYFKFNGTWKKNELALVFEKDLGEVFFKKGNLVKIGYQLNSTSLLKQLNIGTYNLHIGEGLIHSNSFYIGGNSTGNSALRINKSSSESNYQLGIGIVVKKGLFKNVTAIAFNPKSGKIVNGNIESYISDGVFDTHDDLKNFNTNWDANLITSNQLIINRLTLAINTKITRLSDDFSPPLKYYNKFYNLPEKFINNSISYNYNNPFFLIRGEVASSNIQGWATTHLLKTTIGENIELNLNFRSFSKDYKSLYSNTYKKSSKVQNEKGFYSQLKYSTYSLSVISRFDIYKNPNPKYLFHSASMAKSYENLIKINVSDSAEIQVKYRYKIGDKESNDSLLSFIKKKYEHILSLRFKYQIHNNWILTTRIAYNDIKITKHITGYTFAQDLTYKMSKQKITVRLAIVNAENWDNRFYMYEYDMLHNFSIPVYYDQASRFYANYYLKINNNWKFWLKYEVSYFANKASISSGKYKINGNKKSLLKWQLRYQF